MGILNDLLKLPPTVGVWFILALIRLVWTFIGQNGYLHPDEYFQSIQIVTEDFFGKRSNRTWEFTGEKPIRNIAIPLVLYGIPIKLLSALVDLNVLELSTANLIRFPRLAITLLSYLNDYYLFKCARMLKLKPSYACILFSSSYITLVYLTHTFSNSIETALFTSLVYYTLKSKTSIIGLIIAIGVFNRPTFIIYSIAPLAYHLHKAPRTLKTFFNLINFAVPACVLFVAIDSVYYRQSIEIDFDSLVITPLNFFLYNINGNNLEQHGTHAFYQHALVNCFLLFGLNYLILIFQFNKKNGFLYSLFGVPLLCFTLISHQEPRFLLPLIVPVCLLTAHVTLKRVSLTAIWVLFNFCLVLVYGVYHQGALIRAIDYVNGVFKHTSNSDINTHVFFYHTYMPPVYLINVRQNDYNASNKRIHDVMASSGLDKLEIKISEVVAENGKNDLALFLIAPSVVDRDLCDGRKFKYEVLYKYWFHAQFESFFEQLDLLICKYETCNFKCKNFNFIELFLYSLTLNFYQIIVL